MVEEELVGVISVLNEIISDATVPKNVKTKLQEAVDALNEEKEIRLTIEQMFFLLFESCLNIKYLIFVF